MDDRHNNAEEMEVSEHASEGWKERVEGAGVLGVVIVGNGVHVGCFLFGAYYPLSFRPLSPSS